MTTTKKVIKALKHVFLILASISTMFSLWYSLYHLIAHPEISLKDAPIIEISFALMLVSAITAFILWLWEVELLSD